MIRFFTFYIFEFNSTTDAIDIEGGAIMKKSDVKPKLIKLMKFQKVDPEDY